MAEVRRKSMGSATVDRFVIVLDKGSSCAVIEDLAPKDAAPYLNAAAAVFLVPAGSTAEYVINFDSAASPKFGVDVTINNCKKSFDPDAMTTGAPGGPGSGAATLVTSGFCMAECPEGSNPISFSTAVCADVVKTIADCQGDNVVCVERDKND